MKYCVFCGKPIDEDARFCEECGQVQETNATTVEEIPAAEKKSKAPLLIILLSAGVVTMMAAVVLLAWGLGLFGSNEDRPANAPSLSGSIVDPTFPEDPAVSTTTAPTTTTTQPAVVVEGSAVGVEVIPDACDVKEPYTVIADGGLHIRSGPATRYRSLGIVPDRARVMIYHKDGDWFYGAYNGQLGWFNAAYLLVVTEYVETPAYEEYEFKGYYRVTSDNGVNMRSGPGTQYAVVGGIPYAGDIEAYKRSGDWLYGKYLADGTYGWVLMDHLQRLAE